MTFLLLSFGADSRIFNLFSEDVLEFRSKHRKFLLLLCHFGFPLPWTLCHFKLIEWCAVRRPDGIPFPDGRCPSHSITFTTLSGISAQWPTSREIFLLFSCCLGDINQLNWKDDRLLSFWSLKTLGFIPRCAHCLDFHLSKYLINCRDDQGGQDLCRVHLVDVNWRVVGWFHHLKHSCQYSLT